MVLPTYAAWRYGWGLYWAWAFASTYVILLALTFFLRFRQGKWRSMPVIETPSVRGGQSIHQTGSCQGRSGRIQSHRRPGARCSASEE